MVRDTIGIVKRLDYGEREDWYSEKTANIMRYNTGHYKDWTITVRDQHTDIKYWTNDRH